MAGDPPRSLHFPRLRFLWLLSPFPFAGLLIVAGDTALIISSRYLLRVTMNAMRQPQPKQSAPNATTMMNCNNSLIAPTLAASRYSPQSAAPRLWSAAWRLTAAPAPPRNRHKRAFARCRPSPRRPHRCPRQTRAAGSVVEMGVAKSAALKTS
jgi:hypothetical protein